MEKESLIDEKVPQKEREIDWLITILPMGSVIILCILFFLMPEQSGIILSKIRFLWGDTFGIYYLIIGLGIFYCLCSLPVQSTEILFLENRMKNPGTLFLRGVP